MIYDMIMVVQYNIAELRGDRCLVLDNKTTQRASQLHTYPNHSSLMKTKVKGNPFLRVTGL